MRRIYVALEALQAPSDHPDKYLGTGIAPYARAFLAWAAEHGKVTVITDGSLSYANYLLRTIHSTERVSVRGFDSSKTELLEGHDDVYLVDSILTPSETSWFTEHGMGDRVVGVNPHEGVTPAAKQALEAKFGKSHRPA